MGRLAILLGDLIPLIHHVILSYSYRFMSGYLYFPNNLRDIKDNKTKYKLIWSVAKSFSNSYKN